MYFLDLYSSGTRTNCRRTMQWNYQIYLSRHYQSSYIGFRHFRTKWKFHSVKQFNQTYPDVGCVRCHGGFCVHRRNTKRFGKISDSRESREEMLSAGVSVFQNGKCEFIAMIFDRSSKRKKQQKVAFAWNRKKRFLSSRSLEDKTYNFLQVLLIGYRMIK